MTIASNYPTVAPSLDLDFANSQQLDPRISFTRAGTATYYDGETSAIAEQNLLTQSQAFFITPWVLANASFGPLGSELIINGDFASSANWTLAGNWSIAGGSLVGTGATNSASQTSVTTAGNFYRVSFDYNCTSGNSIRICNTSSTALVTFATSPSTSGSVVGYFTATGTSVLIEASAAAYTGTIDNFSVKQVNQVTAPDGTSTATTFTADTANATITQSVNAAAAADYTFSVYLRRVTGTGNIDITAHSGGTWVTQTITSSWARYTVTQTLTAGARTPGIRIVTSGDVIEVWGCQIEQRSSVTAYNVTTTATITNYIPQLLTAPLNTPRFDFNPITRVSLGLLMEEQRTNLLLQSEDFSTTWTATRATVSTNINIAPTGALTADGIIASTDNDTHFVSQTFTGTAASHTFTVYAKAYGLNFIALRLFNGTSQVGLAYYNLSTGATGTVTAGTASIQSVGNNWYRCVLTATLAASASCTADIQLANADNTNSFTGNAFSGVTIWGAQLEAGAFLTSYIPTVASQVTRAIDAASITGTNFSSWYNNAEGTVYVEHNSAKPSNNSYGAFVISDNSSSNRFGHAANISGTQQSFYVVVAGVVQANILYLSSATVGSFIKSSATYKVNDFAASGNGATAVANTVGTIPVVNRLDLGHFFPGAPSTNTLNGTIKKFAYYPIRVTNAQLQALTGS